MKTYELLTFCGPCFITELCNKDQQIGFGGLE
jgi:hypothetical protein